MSTIPEIAVLDVAYAAHGAGVACVTAEQWASPAPLREDASFLPGVPAGYQPGKFYLRELPLLELAVDRLMVRPKVLVIDGYVWLDGEGRPGLGARLFDSLEGRIAVVGLAKTRLRGDDWSAEVLRGSGSRPIFVTAAGIDLAVAAREVLGMHGAHRLPTLVKRADYLARRAAVGAVRSELAS